MLNSEAPGKNVRRKSNSLSINTEVKKGNFEEVLNYELNTGDGLDFNFSDEHVMLLRHLANLLQKARIKLRTVGFNAKHGRIKCTVTGEYDKDGSHMSFSKVDCPLRTDESFRRALDEGHHKEESINKTANRYG
ncbi:unnamed protein product [Brassicogethes aeneus]|uniref:Uncharacterized protein n=1 Tax=Brassicogethes aeneus TaxID=1431903 RepID=A0A9P0AXU1_BRAAE|nr:unnamed protein product [Brassicogethes aeneus]